MTVRETELGARYAFFLRALATRSYLSLKTRPDLRLALLTHEGADLPADASARASVLCWDSTARLWALDRPNRAAGVIGANRLACMVTDAEQARQLCALLPGQWQVQTESAPDSSRSIFERIGMLIWGRDLDAVPMQAGRIALHQSRLVDLVASNRGETRRAVLFEAGCLLAELTSLDHNPGAPA